jgi:16S rRNA (cytidine1402-2'-O)-methyltransferase
VSTLYLVSTPIGNLSDLSPRAAETLRGVSRILCEDTRRTRVLVDHVDARAPLVSVHAHNERERIGAILGWLEAGEDVAMVSDAGTPLVSDPGARVVSAVSAAGHRVIPIPGASAALAALVASGLPAERFTFLGFPARKGAARSADLARVVGSAETAVLFESPHRLVALLDDLAGLCAPNRRVSVSRELTKLHEETLRGTLAEVAAHYRERTPKGEVTVVVEPAPAFEARQVGREEVERLAEGLLREGMKPSEVSRELVDRLALARNEAYRIVHDLRDNENDSTRATGNAVIDE